MGGAEGAPDAPRGSREYIRWAIEGSLRRLEVERIDLYQYHQPDGTTPIAETLRRSTSWSREGLVGAIGCSNFSAAELEEAERVAPELGPARFVTLQNHYSLLERGIEAEVAPACERLGVSILPFFPLDKRSAQRQVPARRAGARGDAPGRRRARRAPTAQFDVVEAIGEYAEQRGVGTIDVAIAGLAAQPAVASVIAGATRPEQIEANVATLRWSPGAEDLAELDRIAPTPRG